MLDIDHGTYPFVTSSSASAGGACTGTGVRPPAFKASSASPKPISPASAADPSHRSPRRAGDQIRSRGNEFGAVTGRPRRCGWFDVPLLRYTAAINGFDSIVVTKLDVLDDFDQIPVCVAYRIDGREICGMPPTVAEIAKIEPVYECVLRLDHRNLRHLKLRRSAGQGEGVHRVSRGPHRRRGRLYLHRP